MRTLLVVIALAGVSIFSFGQIARAQVGGAGIPAPITLTATVVKVFAATGTTVHVHGFRY